MVNRPRSKGNPRIHALAGVAALACALVGATCGGGPAPRPEPTLALRLAARLPEGFSPPRWRAFVDGALAWEASSEEPVDVEVALPPRASVVQLSLAAEGPTRCPSARVAIEIARTLRHPGGPATLSLTASPGPDGRMAMHIAGSGLSPLTSEVAATVSGPPYGADERALGEYLYQLLRRAQRAGNLSTTACVTRRVDLATRMLSDREAPSPSAERRATLFSEHGAHFERSTRTARLRALADAAAQCFAGGDAPAPRREDLLDAWAPTACGLGRIGDSDRSASTTERESPTGGDARRYPGRLPEPARRQPDTLDVTVEHVQ